MAVAVPTLRVDWWNTGRFSDALDTVHPLDKPALKLERGRSADFTTDATGQLTWSCDNSDYAYNPDRNWCDNPSFEVDTSGWSVTAISGLLAAATSITQVTDNAPNAGTRAAEIVCPATLDAGASYAIPYRFHSGRTYAVSVSLKSMSGSRSVGIGIGSAGTPADVATGAGTVTTSWAAYTLTWTPSADRLDAVVFVRVLAASAATVRIDAVQVNPGSTANVYIEAPTKGQLVPGRPVHLYGTYSATQYPLFYGYLERITPDLMTKTVQFTAYDVLRRFSETEIVVPPNAYIQRTGRDMRIEALGDYERGVINLCHNGSIETNTSGWDNGGSGGTISRNTGDAAPGLGSACLQFAASSANQRVEFPLRLAPVFFANQTYRFSVWLKLSSGTASWTLGAFVGTWTGSGIQDHALTLTSTWTRYTFTVVLPSTGSAASGPLTFFLLQSTSASTVLVDGLMVSRGEADPAYTTAVNGRWPNWCGNGSFDGGALNGWYDAYTNLCGNGSFEAGTSGWTGAGLSQSSTYAEFGSYCAALSPGYADYALSGTFKAGQRYDFSIWVRNTTTSVVQVWLQSTGTPTDGVTNGPSTGYGNVAFTQISLNWTPSADRTDARVQVYSAGGTTYFDGVLVVRRDISLGAQVYPYSDTGPAGGGSFVTSRGFSTTAKYGYQSQSAVTPATATAGRVYDFNHYGVYFLSGQAYTASVWLNPSSLMPYKIGLSANKGDGTFDEATTTGTAPANTWTQVTVTWTPTADRSCATALSVFLSVLQTDATARTVLIDGVRVIPGSSADNYEQPYWNIPATAEHDGFATSASLQTDLLSALKQLNDYLLSRHWMSATMSAPYWQYNVQDRNAYAVAASVESYEDGSNACQATTPPEIDRQALVNIIQITANTGAEWYPDGTSITEYGYHPATALSAPLFYGDQTIPALVAAAYLSRYSQPVRRPTITVENRFPSQLQRDVNDAVWLTIAPWTLSMFANVARLTTTVDASGQHWKTEYQLEESLQPDG